MPPDGTMHAELETDHFTIMASDAMPGSEEQWGGTRIYLAFMGDDLETLQGWFDKLGADGRVGQPLHLEAWGDTYGDVKDKFGIEWLFNISAPRRTSLTRLGTVPDSVHFSVLHRPLLDRVRNRPQPGPARVWVS